MSAASPREGSFIERFRRFLFGDDIFISYSRADSTYALALANELTKRNLSCFLDQWGTPPGKELPRQLIDTIKRCSTLVLIGTNHAATSENVGKEVKEFLTTGRPIIPITFVDDKLLNDRSENFNAQDLTGSLESSGWYPLISGIAKTTDTLQALQSRTPSENVLLRIVNAVQFRSRSRRLRKTFVVTLVSILFLVLLGSFLLYGLNKKVNAATKEASDATALAIAKTEQANIASERANTEAKRAKQQEDIANQKQQEADNATEEATKQTGIAREQARIASEKTSLAQEQTRLADAASKRAHTQQSIAEATQLSNHAVELLTQKDPAVFRQSLNSSITANEKVDANGLTLIEPISSLRRILSATPRMMEETSSPVMSFPCDQIAISANQKTVACQEKNSVAVYRVSGPQVPIKIYEFADELATREIEAGSPSNACMSNRREGAVAKIERVNVSDDGNSVAISIVDEFFDEDGSRDGMLDGHRLVFKNAKGESFCKDTDDVGFIFLGPDSSSIIYSDVNSSQGDLDLDINKLNLWRIGSDPEVLECNYSAQVGTILSGSFSPNGKWFVTANMSRQKSSVIEVHKFQVDKPMEAARCTQNPLYSTESDAPSPYLVRSYDLEIGYGFQGIAIDNTGSKIAVGSDGVSVWDDYPFPRLIVYIPSQESPFASVSFTNAPDQATLSTSLEDNSPADKSQENSRRIINQTWSLNGYKSEDTESAPNDDLTKIEGFVSTHPKLRAEKNGTRVTILRKNDGAVVDYIDLGSDEIAEAVVFSIDGSEIITKSYDSGTLSMRNEQLNGYRDYNYKKWTIGYQNLQKIVNQRLSKVTR